MATLDALELADCQTSGEYRNLQEAISGCEKNTLARNAMAQAKSKIRRMVFILLLQSKNDGKGWYS